VAWTRHGHQIPASPVEEPEPDAVARCGGPALCTKCREDVARWQISGDSYERVRSMTLEDVRRKVLALPHCAGCPADLVHLPKECDCVRGDVLKLLDES
jgi:hypothetical protein